MSIIFKAEKHEYSSIEDDGIDWVSVTTFIGNFKQPFDAPTQALKSSKNKKSKWYKLTVEDILLAWKTESKRATDLGTWYHDQRERDICELNSIERSGVTIPIYRPIEDQGVKFAPEQKLEDGLYPEHMVYLKSAGICGQSDLVEIVNGKVNITDYKTNKEIKLSGYKNWEGITTKMSSPINNLDDCSLNHYTLQLSIYMYIILRHNPKLKVGELTINHIIFEEVGRDKYDNPISARDSNGDPIVKEITEYKLPYLKAEVNNLLTWLKDNRSKLKSKN